MYALARPLILAAALAAASAASAQTVTCSSDDGRRHSCPADTRGGVDLVRQRSESACTQGYSWGYDDRGIWVDHGCRADFAPRGGRGDEAAATETLTCSSEDGRRHYCDADTRGGVELVRQRSGSPCTRDYSWGYDDRGIWVDHGCRADFLLGADDDRGEDSLPTLTCSSDDGRRRFCEADTRRGVRLVRQRSESTCIEGDSWGYDDRGIWVDRGCRADFVLRRRRHRDRERGAYDEGRTFAERTLSCSSEDGRRHYCAAETGGGVRLVRQRSESACSEGYSWGYDDGGIWVDHGCRADFALASGAESCARSAGMERAWQMADQCLQVSPATHPPCNTQNACSLIIDEIRRGCARLGRDAPAFCESYR